MITTEFSQEDNCFIARIAEQTLLVAHGDTAEEAILELENLLVDVVRDLQDSGEIVPKSLAYWRD